MKTSDAGTLEVINSLSWFHSIELPGGVITPGASGPPNKAILSLFDTIDFKGKLVLDIGCWDGLWSFEAEKRGAATIFATDDLSQRSHSDQHTFTVAHELLKSKVIYRPNISVYEIDKLEKRDFDIILFFGVYYHLKHPLYALSKLRGVCREGGLLLAEGPLFNNHKISYAKFYYNQWYVNDRANWWVASVKCFREMLECSFFRVDKEIDTAKLQERPNNFAHAIVKNVGRAILNGFFPKRYLIQAVAVSRTDHNYVCPDPDLRQFDQNQYCANPPRPKSLEKNHMPLIDRLAFWWTSRRK